jgi:hypothetical protein
MKIFVNEIMNGRCVRTAQYDCDHRCGNWDGCGGRFAGKDGRISCWKVLEHKERHLDWASPAYDGWMKIYGSVRDGVKMVNLVRITKKENLL